MKTLNLIITALFAASLLSACGRATTVYSDGGGDAVGDALVGTDGRSVLPNGFYDQSVNHAIVDISNDTSPTALRFRLLGGTSAAGAFNDSTSTGNRALLGIGKYDQSALAKFSLSLTASSPSTGATSAAPAISVSLIVDINCDGTSAVRTLISDSLLNGTSGRTTNASATANDAIWSVSGAAITDSSSNVVVPSHAGTMRSDLTQLLAAYPNACLRNDRSDDPEAPANLPIGSVLLSIGGATSSTVETLTLSDLTINGDNYQTWGQR